MIHIIEDERDLNETIVSLLEIHGINNVLSHSNWTTCNPDAGDVILHDITGVGELFLVKGVRYISMSGVTDDTVCVDIIKPFDIMHVIEKLKKVA